MHDDFILFVDQNPSRIWQKTEKQKSFRSMGTVFLKSQDPVTT